MFLRKYILVLLAIVLISSQLFPRSIKYFKLNKVITVSGKIIKVGTDKKEHGDDFVIIELENKKNIRYTIEVSPKWFYEIDIVKGDIIEVKGSLNIIDKNNIILTQSIIRRGEIYNFRDKLGFPLWRGMGKGLNGKRGFGGKRRRKGKY